MNKDNHVFEIIKHVFAENDVIYDETLHDSIIITHLSDNIPEGRAPNKIPAINKVDESGIRKSRPHTRSN